MKPDEKAAKILADALARYPNNVSLSKKDFSRVYKFLEMVFIPGVLGDTTKRRCFQQLEHEILPAVGVLLKSKDIADNATSTLEAFCLTAPKHIEPLYWHNSPKLWQACLGTAISDPAYLTFRKFAVDKVRPPLVQALPSSNSTQPITISSLLQGGAASQQEVDTRPLHTVSINSSNQPNGTSSKWVNDSRLHSVAALGDSAVTIPLSQSQTTVSPWTMTCSLCSTTVRLQCACKQTIKGPSSTANPTTTPTLSILLPATRTAPGDRSSQPSDNNPTNAPPTPTETSRKRLRTGGLALTTAVTIQQSATGQTLTSQLDGTESSGLYRSAARPLTVRPDQVVPAPQSIQTCSSSTDPPVNHKHPIEDFSTLMRKHCIDSTNNIAPLPANPTASGDRPHHSHPTNTPLLATLIHPAAPPVATPTVPPRDTSGNKTVTNMMWTPEKNNQ